MTDNPTAGAPVLLTTAEAAAYLRTTPGALRTARSRGRGPRAIKGDGVRVYYTLAELQRYAGVEAVEVQP